VGLRSDLSKPLYENLIQNDQQVWNEHIRLFAIPTTSGTGSEVTPFATMWDSKTQKKYSISTAFMYPETAILDASLTLTLPKKLTLYTGLDAISHSLESLWNKNKTDESQSFALKSLELANSSFLKLLEPLLIQSLIL
jgi:alcohol dehydrogenase class IV